MWKFENACIKTSVCARKSREKEILIKSTRGEGATIMNKVHLLTSPRQPDEGSIAKPLEFYLQLSAFNLPPSHF